MSLACLIVKRKVKLLFYEKENTLLSLNYAWKNEFFSVICLE